MDKAEELLTIKGVKPTANRVLILRSLMTVEHPISLSEMEEILPDMDKSSIFRTLGVFMEHHVTHEIDDGGSIKYEVCLNGKECNISDLHPHFHCEVCHETTCLHNLHIPNLPLPEGYETQAINFMIKGICPKCKKKQIG